MKISKINLIIFILILTSCEYSIYDKIQFEKLIKLSNEFNFPSRIESNKFNEKLKNIKNDIKYIHFAKIGRIEYGALILPDNSRIDFVFENRIYSHEHIKKPDFYEPYPHTIFIYNDEILKFKGCFYYGVFDILYMEIKINNIKEFKQFLNRNNGIYP